MARRIVFTPAAGEPPPAYSQAVVAAGLVFVSGTAPTDPATGAFTGTSIQEQTRQCLTNIRAILDAAGSSLDRIVSATVVLADEDDFAGMNEEWIRWFPVDPPARQGAKMPVRVPGLKVSIAVIAEAGQVSDAEARIDRDKWKHQMKASSSHLLGDASMLSSRPTVQMNNQSHEENALTVLNETAWLIPASLVVAVVMMFTWWNAASIQVNGSTTWIFLFATMGLWVSLFLVALTLWRLLVSRSNAVRNR